MTLRRLIALTAVLVTIASVPARADSISADIRFGDLEVSVIRDYYDAADRNKRKNRNNGRALPPGIAKNLERGKSLPPGIAKQSLPAELVRQLPPVPDGYERIIVGGKVLLVEIATQVIHDILTDVIIG